MNGISMQEAISFGGWYACHVSLGAYAKEAIDFRLRVLAFERTSPRDVCSNIAPKDLVEGVLWLLTLEIVNLNKVPVEASKVSRAVKVADADGFEFHPALRDLTWPRGSVLRRFTLWGDPLSPKIAAKGSIAFDLPDEENTYRLVLIDGSIKEA